MSDSAVFFFSVDYCNLLDHESPQKRLDFQAIYIMSLLVWLSSIKRRWIAAFLLLIFAPLLACECSVNQPQLFGVFIVKSRLYLQPGHLGTEGCIFWPLTDGNTWKLHGIKNSIQKTKTWKTAWYCDWKNLWNAFQPYYTILQLLAVSSCCLLNLINTKHVFGSITPGWMPHVLAASYVNGLKKNWASEDLRDIS